MPGFIDMLSLPWSVKRTALVHMTINLVVVALYVINAWMRRGGVADAAIWLSVICVGLLVISGWLGGKMVYVLGIAVQPAPGPAETPRHTRYGI